MEDTVSYFSGPLLVMLLVLGNAYFVAGEFALVRAHPTKLKTPDIISKFGARSALKLLDELDLILSTTQLGITALSLLLGWLGERTFATLFLELFRGLGEPASLMLGHGLATTLALILVTFLHVVIGELCAKSVAIRHPEEVLRYLAPSLLLISRSCRWVIYLFNGCANLFLALFGMRTVPESDRVHSSTELSMLISHSTEYGILDKSEEEMLKGIFGFSETVAREVMTPRTDLVTIPVTSTFDEVLETVTKSGYSRFPVVADSIDNVVGILLARDLLNLVPDYAKSPSRPFELKRNLREAYFIPGTKPIDDLLNEFKSRKLHMAIVLDEHGGVDGAVTLEDLIEEIVGDIFDESDKAETDVVIEDDGDILLDGGLLVADVNEKFELGIPEGDYDTIGGFIFSALGRMSQAGDRVHVRNKHIVQVNDISVNGNGKEAEAEDDSATADSTALQRERQAEAIFTVERLSGNRIETIRVHRITPEETSELPTEELGTTILERETA
jgi:putative hemolysin